ncbi:MAG: SPFH domain-containing protein [Planctomycetota bacterium]
MQDRNELSAADKSLSEALRVSFIVLTVIMVALVVGFLAFGGFRMVESDEQALVLSFGKISGVGENRLLKPGLHWAWPYPIQEIVKIPVAKKTNLAIDTFWYLERRRTPQELDPINDGYCITRGEKQEQGLGGLDGNDYNIVHSKWQLTYQIDDAENFFKNVYTDDIVPGQSYADVIARSIAPLLKSLIADSIVTAMVDYTIDEAISNQHRITEHVEKLLQAKLVEIGSGIKVVSVQLTNILWPQQVNDAFLASIQASQRSQTVINEAKTYAENTINETAGPIADELLAVLEGKKTVSEQEEEILWSQLAGAAQEQIAQARAYRTKVVETAKANAEYLQEMLPEYKKRPELVIQKIYLDAIEYVLNKADEKFIIQAAEGAKEREVRIKINRDPTLKPKSTEKQE